MRIEPEFMISFFVSVRSVALLALLSTGCADPATDPAIQLRFETALSESIEVFQESRLPNAMVRPPGFDLPAHLATLEARHQEFSKVFHSSDGARFLAARIDREQEEPSILAILQLLHESKQPISVSVFEKFVHHPNPSVSEWAGKYLVMAKRGSPS